MITLKRLSAITAITFGALFTITAIMQIWYIPPFNSYSMNRIIPTLAILTVAFIVLFTILKAMEDKK